MNAGILEEEEFVRETRHSLEGLAECGVDTVSWEQFKEQLRESASAFGRRRAAKARQVRDHLTRTLKVLLEEEQDPGAFREDIKNCKDQLLGPQVRSRVEALEGEIQPSKIFRTHERRRVRENAPREVRGEEGVATSQEEIAALFGEAYGKLFREEELDEDAFVSVLRGSPTVPDETTDASCLWMEQRDESAVEINAGYITLANGVKIPVVNAANVSAKSLLGCFKYLLLGDGDRTEVTSVLVLLGLHAIWQLRTAMVQCHLDARPTWDYFLAKLDWVVSVTGRGAAGGADEWQGLRRQLESGGHSPGRQLLGGRGCRLPSDGQGSVVVGGGGGPHPCGYGERLVYKIPCQDCGSSYIGETGRKKITRMKEHQRDVKYSTNATRLKTELVDHAWTTGHTFDFTAATTLAKEDSVETRKKVAEGSILNSPSGARETSNGRWYNRWPEERTWTPAVIEGTTDAPRSYVVTTEDGQSKRRTREDLRLLPTNTTVENAPSVHGNGTADTSSQQTPPGDDQVGHAPSPADEDATAGATNVQSATPERRSMRLQRKPQRYPTSERKRPEEEEDVMGQS
ncbi:hypothetical protein HPB47_004288 [Ixodes persulcatus]|uniref:Uncharacterized protein n=1 Tax=Ixodes persulcatus TaxID=34615 RepID=A0AC60PH74_IXOPE|nr:hypothetical protein HPB47_004288 [Ixodes persulcatus]